GRRGDLVKTDLPVLLVEQREVSEGAADVDPDAIHALLELDAGFLDHFAPFADLACDALAESRGRARDDDETLRGEEIAHRGSAQCARDVFLNSAHHGGRRARGRE